MIQTLTDNPSSDLYRRFSYIAFVVPVYRDSISFNKNFYLVNWNILNFRTASPSNRTGRKTPKPQTFVSVHTRRTAVNDALLLCPKARIADKLLV